MPDRVILELNDSNNSLSFQETRPEYNNNSNTYLPFPKVSVINVVCGNNVEFMGKCLNSLLENTDYPDVEFVIVSDSGNEMKNYIASLAEYNCFIRLVFRGGKHSNASNRNLGAFHASADSKYYLFADSDVMYSDRQWLKNLVSVSEKFDDIGIIGGGDETTLGHFCSIDNETGILVNEVMEFNGILPDNPVEMMIIPGYSMLIRKSMFACIGGWDEGFTPVYGEDIDICIRCILAGYKVLGKFNKGVQHLYRNTNENNSCERIASDNNRLWLTVASNRRLAMKFWDILPTKRLNSYSLWVDHLKFMRAVGQSYLSRMKQLPPTVVERKLNQLYIPTKDTSAICEIYNAISFDC